MPDPSSSTNNDPTSAKGPISSQAQASGQSPSDVFNQVFAAYEQMKITRQIFSEIYGQDALPDEVAGFNFCSLTELRRIAAELQVGPGQTFVDLGCGMGGLGLWVARETGANLVGVDFSSEAIRQAEQRAARMGQAERARFQLADMAATGLPEGAFDGVISTDVIVFARDKREVMREVFRILRRGGRFIFTVWEDRRPEGGEGPGSPEKTYDYRPMLLEAGFRVDHYEELEDWERRQRGVYQATLARRVEIQEEMGEQAAAPLIEEALFFTEMSDGRDRLSTTRHVLVISLKE